MNLKPGQTIGRLPARRRVIVAGREVQLYGVGWLALMAARDPQSVRSWERSGLLPKPLVAIPGHPDRWYLAVEIETYAAIFQKARPNRQTGFAATSFKEDCWRANQQLRKALTAHEARIFLPLARQEEMEEAARHFQQERQASRQERVLSVVQREARRKLMKLMPNPRKDKHESR